MFRRSLSVCALLLGSASADAATITVTNTSSSGLGSLSKAITDANATVAADVIQFGILSLSTVTIPGPLPAITQPLTINGYSQGTAQANTTADGTNAVIRVELSGSGAEDGEAVLDIQADNVVVSGLAIRNLGTKVYGVRIAPGADLAQIHGCFIGTTADGTTDSSQGIGIRDEGTSTIIGGNASVARRNVISGNDGGGIDVRGVGALIANNLIGTDRSGEQYVPNGRGIIVETATADDVRIGGEGALLDRNLIAGNDAEGIDVLPNVVGNVEIEGNSFRDNDALAIDLGSDGVTRNDSSDADFGPNHLQNYPELTFARLNGTFVEVEGFLPGPAGMNKLEFYTLPEPDASGFGEGTKLVAQLSPTTDGSGYHFRYLIELENPIFDPLYVTATAQNLTTHETSEFSNTVEALAGGTKYVVTNSNDAGAGSLRAAIEAANANPGADSVTFNIPDPAQQIVLQSSLTISEAVIVDGFSQPGAQPNTLSFGSNAVLEIEVDGSGISSGGNFVVNADHVVLRGMAINNGTGIGVQYSSGDFGRIEGCYVGTNLAGTAGDGNNSHGIFTGQEAHSIAIGGDLASQRNIVSGNSTHGMRVTGDDAVIKGNIVGADATGAVAIPNGFNGISIEGWDVNVGNDGVSNTGQNLSAFNGQDGILVSSVAKGVTILGNSVFENGDLGIDLSVSEAPGVTPNDSNDSDDGANRLQNFPVITDVSTTGGETTVEGFLDVPTNVTDGEYVIRVYSSPACDESGHGEGKFFQGARTVVLSNSAQTFSVTVSKGVSSTSAVVATATDVLFGNTSEFSACASLDTQPPLCGDASGDDAVTAGDALTVLKTAVGSASCEKCICDVNSSDSVTSGDALQVLRLAVGQPVELNCTPCLVIPPI